MKKKLIIVFIITLLFVFIIYGANAAASDSWWTNKQVVAHNIAEEARSLGLSEDDPIITRAQELWWEDYPPASYQPAPTKTYLGTYYITGYDICYSCCGKIDGITASGVKATVGRTIAAPSNLPFGTINENEVSWAIKSNIAKISIKKKKKNIFFYPFLF